MDLIDIYRTFHPKATEHTFFSSEHGTLSKIYHILGYKSNLGNFKKTAIISSIFSNHNAIQLDSNSKGKNCKKNPKHNHVETKQDATKQPKDH